MSTAFSTTDQLKRAIQISEAIEKLEAELASVLGDSQAAAPHAAPKADGRRGRRTAATRAKMAAAQKARRTKKGGASAIPETILVEDSKAEKKRVMSPEARSRIGAAQKKRWAAAKAAK